MGQNLPPPILVKAKLQNLSSIYIFDMSIDCLQLLKVIALAIVAIRASTIVLNAAALLQEQLARPRPAGSWKRRCDEDEEEAVLFLITIVAAGCKAQSRCFWMDV